MLGYLDDTTQGLLDFSYHLELERDGDNAHGEDTLAAGDLGNYGRCAGSCTTAHAGGDECHLCAVVKEPFNLLAALLGGLACYGRVITGTQALGYLDSQLHLLWDG